MSTPRPISPEALVAGLAERVSALPSPAVIAVDGPAAAAPELLADSLVERLRTSGTPVAHVQSRWFWRDASVRLEFGRKDPEAYLDWLDAAALRREVIEPMHADGTYLPSLRDPATNRATRTGVEALGPRGVLIISGEFLLRHALDFDLSVHLWTSSSALARRTPADQLWTLPAFARYESQTQPGATAAVVVRCDDPRHPAVLGL